MVQDDKDSTAPGLYHIIIGPPTEQEALDPLLAGAGGQVVLVEPDPDRAAQLESRGDVRVIAAALDSEAGAADLVQYNFPGLRSIKAPTPALKEALPGLQEVSRKQTVTITVQELADRLGELAGSVHLYLHAPGSEMQILHGLDGTGLFPQIAGIHLCCGAEPMFEGASGRDELLAFILERGFKLTAEEADDPDWPELRFAVDQQARDLEAAHARIADLEEAQKASAQQVADLEKTVAAQNTAKAQGDEALTGAQAEIDSLKSRVEEAETALETEQSSARQLRETLNKRNSELEARNKALADAKEAHAKAAAQSEEAQAEIDGLKARNAEMEAALEEEQKNTQTVREALHKRNGELEARTKAMAATRESYAKAEAQSEEALSEARAEIDDLKTQIEALNAELKASSKAAKAVKKTLAKCEARLKDRTMALKFAKAETETLTAALQKAKAARGEDQKALNQTRETLNSRETEFETCGKKLATARAEIVTLTAASEAGQQVAVQLEQSKADLAVALRMQMLAQADLRDLQTRFHAVEQVRSAQQQLLEKLTPRLQQAARQLQQMQLAETEAATRLKAEDPAPDPKPKPRAKRAPRKPRAAKT